MKPSRGLLRPARCAVALVQLAAPMGGLVQATGAADIKRAPLWRLGTRGGGAGRGAALTLTRTRARARARARTRTLTRSLTRSLTLTCSSAPQRYDPGEWRTAREQRSTCQRVRGEGCVPCQILLRLANAGQGKPGGRAAAPCRGAAAARGVSGKSVQATATVHPSGAVPAQSDAKAGGASAGAVRGGVGDGGVGASHPWVVRF